MILSSGVYAKKMCLTSHTKYMDNASNYRALHPRHDSARKNPAFSFSYFLWICSLLTIKGKFANQVCFGGGKRPRRPRAWKTKNRRGSCVKSQKLVDLIATLPSTKEAVYGGLDTWVAWEIEFPVITIKKALSILRDQEEWKRVIQVL